MREPFPDRAVTIRRAYYYPFWQIERTAQRWNWDVARSAFDPNEVPRDDAQRFYRFWQNRLFGAAPKATSREGFIYVPLQGRLADHRSFQSCSPFEMLEQVLERAGVRRVVATLHPNESYSKDDLDRLDSMARRHGSLSVSTAGMQDLLQRCDFVVTQNSSAAFAGYFFGKPSVLYARIDFHHIAASVEKLGTSGAFDAVEQMRPDYAAYLWWFLQHMSINAGRPDAEDRIAVRLGGFGWPVS
ncbi:hypothetical protein SAMN04490248_101370 [Salinihabitans flavidus]|uniref:Capsule polysaccharide biosynthesis protein n=2 Tax=Salinihabitans flavidus TaxID=569882 RepID=A0A1H8M053_9RHOB|nr:hypothetical protein SAMN04490248_101370 [Salinihabitans flavidus]